MTKEPNKDFRESLHDQINDFLIGDISAKRLEVCILALCKEMLVPARSLSGVKIIEVGVFEPFEDGPEDIGWNACRSELLKQLGEK